MGFDYKCDFDLKDCLEALGIEEKGRVQQFVTSEFMKNVQEYVPFDVDGLYEQPGRLIDSCHIENDTDVVWETPYARRLYYHPEYNYQGSPIRGGYWADRYLQDGGMEQLKEGVRSMIEK